MTECFHLPTVSFPRKRESISRFERVDKWIPAFAGMTLGEYVEPRQIEFSEGML